MSEQIKENDELIEEIENTREESEVKKNDIEDLSSYGETKDESSNEDTSEADLEKMKREIRKREKRKKKAEKIKARDDKKRYRISGVVAIVAGVIEVLWGLVRQSGSGTNLVLGSTFICLGYLYYKMGKREDNE